MWIRTQNKESLLEISHLDVYSLSENNWTIEDCGSDLGTYKSKERAIEVLDEIQACIERYEADKASGRLFTGFVTYEMPEK